MTTKTQSQTYEIYQQNDIAQAVEFLEFIQTHRQQLDDLPKCNFWLGHCDFDNVTRPDVLKILKAFPGKWDKAVSYTNDGLNYTLQGKVSGLEIRVYNGEPPASCKIEETVEYVVVPEKVERRVKRTIKCPEPATNES